MRFASLRNWSLVLLLALPIAVQAQSGAKPKKLKAPTPDPDRIYDLVSHPAEPEGGLEAYDKYLNDHLNYPTKALEGKVQGIDSVQFIVEKNGRISNVKLVQGFDPDCDAEALRVIRAAPKWVPARHRGEVVRQRITVPIAFAPPGAGSKEALAEVVAEVPVVGGVDATTSAPAGAATASAPANTPAGRPAGPKVIQPEVGAQPVGGTEAFFKWVQDNLQYPAAAKRQKLEGKVRVEFMIEPDGSLSNVKALNHLGGGLEQEAIRVIKAAPNWEPARYQGQAIRQKMVVPVIFQL